jgi:exodeoxyribonuclease VII small subunit
MPPKKDAKLDIAKSFQELEETAAWFEQGDADVDKGLAKFERAMEIADALKTRLTDAENKVKEIKKKYE